MRILALDVGDRRIGVALSDPLGIVATPLKIIVRAGGPGDIDEILRLTAENEVGRIAVGMPVSLSGREGQQAAKVRAFVEELTAETDLPVIFLDERYSSVEAQRLLSQPSGRSQRRPTRGRLDATAAAVILQAYLDANRPRSGGEGLGFRV